MKKVTVQNKIRENGGYALYTSIILTGILILVAYATANLSIQQLALSVSGAESHIAFYNADAGLECALYGDLKSGSVSAFDTSTAGTLSCNGQTITTGSQTVQTTPSQSSVIGGGASGGGGIVRKQFIHNYPGTNNPTTAVTFSSANTLGNFIYVEYSWSGTVSNPTISDSRGNTYTPLTKLSILSGSQVSVQVWYAENIKAGANTITVSNGGDDGGMTAIEYSGVVTSNSLDLVSTNAVGTANAATVSPSSGSFNPSAGDLIINTFADERTVQGTITPSVGYSIVNTDVQHVDAVEDTTNASAGSQTAWFNTSVASNNWIMHTVAFKKAVSSGSATPSIFQLNFTNGCAIVKVTKNGNGTTDIQSRGYNVCSGSKRLERGVQITY